MVQQRQQNLEKFNQYALLIGQVVVTLCCLCYSVYQHFVTKGTPVAPRHFAGLILFLPSFALWFRARVELARYASFSLFSDQEPPRLVTTGPYRHCRHPVYTFSSLFGLGYLIVVDNWPGVALLLFVGMPVQVYRARQEDAMLRKRFKFIHDEWWELTDSWF